MDDDTLKHVIEISDMDTRFIISQTISQIDSLELKLKSLDNALFALVENNALSSGDIVTRIEHLDREISQKLFLMFLFLCAVGVSLVFFL